MRNIFIPSDIFDNLISGLAADIAKLQPDMVSGQVAPHQIAELLAGYGIAPEDVAKQIIDDMCDSAARRLEEGIPAIARPAA
jgi:hypothetical protein